MLWPHRRRSFKQAAFTCRKSSVFTLAQGLRPLVLLDAELHYASRTDGARNGGSQPRGLLVDIIQLRLSFFLT
jgi:hypothetical protein